MMIVKEFLSGVAIALTFGAFFPYIRSIMRGTTKPHAFSWVIWSICTCIVFLAQLADKGGVGAWPIGFSGAVTIYVALLAYRKKTDSMISRIDWVFFILAMLAIPLWYFTHDALLSVMILTGVDLLGFAPTFRKAYSKPFEEQLTFFVLMSMRNIIAAVALEHYSLITLLFPVATAVACIVFILMVVLRRRGMSCEI